jgi:hypothetical protein
MGYLAFDPGESRSHDFILQESSGILLTQVIRFLDAVRPSEIRPNTYPGAWHNRLHNERQS